MVSTTVVYVAPVPSNHDMGPYGVLEGVVAGCGGLGVAPVGLSSFDLD